MQTLDVQTQKPVETQHAKGARAVNTGNKSAVNGKTGAETARNGSSFLAMIEKMIAGTMEGKADGTLSSGFGIAGRGAGDEQTVPGERNTLIKLNAGKNGKKTVDDSGKADAMRSPLARKRAGNAGIESGDKGHAESVDKENKTDVGFAFSSAKDPRKGLSALEAEESGGEIAEKPGKKAFRGKTAAGLPDGLAGMGSFAPSAMQGANRAVARASDGAETTLRDGVTGAKGGKTARSDKKALISVHDERTRDADALAASPLAKSVRVNGDGSADMTIGFRNAESGKASLAGEETRLAERRDGDGKSFASMLSQELRSNAADFVKTGAIVLRDNNAGTIRLTLHPESLGNVKISLELSGDRKISGKIVVSSEEAYEAFNENLSGLSDAFVAGGFESAGFDLSWSGSDSSGYGQKEAAGLISSPFYASSIPGVMSGVDSTDSNTDGYRFSGASVINVFA